MTGRAESGDTALASVTSGFLWIHLTWPLWLTLTVVTVIGIVIGSFIGKRHPRGKA